MARRLSIDFKLLGNLAHSKNMLMGVAPDIRKAYLRSQSSIADKLLRIVRRHLVNQDLSWEPLSLGTIDKKRHDLILIDTETYLNSIDRFQSGYNIFVGVKKGIMEPKTGMEVSRIAALHEFGTELIPARPLWEPSINELGGKSGIKEQFLNDLASRLTKRGFSILYKRI